MGWDGIYERGREECQDGGSSSSSTRSSRNRRVVVGKMFSGTYETVWGTSVADVLTCGSGGTVS